MRPLFILAFLLLSACAGLPDRPPSADPAGAWAARQARLAQVDTWDLRGRLALRSEQEGAHASLHWVRDQALHRMNLAGPFGGGRVRLVYNDGRAELRDASGDVYRGASVQELLARTTGWRLPLDGLNYWVLGLPAPGAPARVALDDWGRLKTLDQLGWHIEFLEYTEHGRYELPKRVFIRRESDVAGDMLEARIAIERWLLQEPRTAH